MGGDLPRQLSTQQRFILAYILVWSRRESEADPDVPFKTVSKATAIELDDGGTRLARTTEASGRLTSRHTSSFSRAVDSLEDRGLVEADRSGSRLPKRVAVRLTPSGRTTAEELLRRHHDGRYALEFRTLMSE